MLVTITVFSGDLEVRTPCGSIYKSFGTSAAIDGIASPAACIIPDDSTPPSTTSALLLGFKYAPAIFSTFPEFDTVRNDDLSTMLSLRSTRLNQRIRGC